jgi:translation elongation factor EF-1alpha
MEEKEIGRVKHYFGHVSAAVIELVGDLKTGDKIRIRGVHDDVTLDVTSMQIEHVDVPAAKAGDLVGVKVPQKVHENDKVYKVIP